MPDIDALIARLEAASGPDRGLDGLIARDALGWLPYFDLDGDDLLDWPEIGGHWHKPGNPCDGRHSVTNEHADPPAYTASLDAAMSLRKPGTLWAIGSMEEGPFCRLCVPKDGGGFDYVEASAATIEAAALIAILKARKAAA